MPGNGFISLTFDDALPQHLDHAVPVLDEQELNGTFYMHITADTFRLRTEDWKRAAQSGHELGNHTIFHPATERKAWVRRGNAIEDYSLDRMRLELETANNLLAMLDGRTQRTFAYPCSNPYIGRCGWPVRLMLRMGLMYTRWPGIVERCGFDVGSTRLSYEPQLHGLFVAARGGGLLLDHTPPALQQFKRYSLLSAAVEGHALHDMQGFVERSLQQDTWAILQFHGVGGGHSMNCNLRTFTEFVNWVGGRYADRVATVEAIASRLWSPSPLPAGPPTRIR